ncbi:DUF3883 domain-containing protein [Arthrobacter crusticola]|uniref:DUF3883 domain-containing protein n=1 Tax=Arthrobacter crusticola TaxID=2547960 RepID=A0A4R5TZB8_9MICC|nr:DUF3883 domain-containing protein [Arthrobacter crusticola]TDK26586.1 DUF3883 domain-containing protein [Arthrobacter crusticola]
MNLRLFSAAIGAALWLENADVLVSHPSELPSDALRAARIFSLTDEEAFAVVQSTWGKVDAEERLRIGSAGESALCALLAEATESEIHHVALESDGYGYDVAVRHAMQSIHIEVKTTTRRGRLTVYLSRNEYETMLRDPSWIMVAVRIDSESRVVAVATVDNGWICENVPANISSFGTWQSTRLEVPQTAMKPGVTPIIPLVTAGVTSLVACEHSWA